MRETTYTTRCDFCDYGGMFTRPEDFQTLGGVDLCRWCADATPKAWIESGGHLVTFRPDGSGWECTCFLTSADWHVRSTLILARPEVVAALPNNLNATAYAHLNGAL